MNPHHKNPEIGRELLADDLKTRTVYVLIADHKPNLAITAWCVGLIGTMAFFDSRLPRISIGLFLLPDGHFEDALDRRVRVYEYLGEI